MLQKILGTVESSYGQAYTSDYCVCYKGRALVNHSDPLIMFGEGT